MRNPILAVFVLFGLSACRAPVYEFFKTGKGTAPGALKVEGIFMMEAKRVEDTCFSGGAFEYPELIPFVFVPNSDGEVVPGDAILLFENNPVVEDGVSFSFRIPLRYDVDEGEWLGLVIWDPDDEVTMIMYGGDFSGEGGVADYHEATIILEYAPELCDGGNYGTTVTRVSGLRQE